MQMSKLAPILATKPMDLVHIDCENGNTRGSMKETKDEEHSHCLQSLHEILAGICN